MLRRAWLLLIATTGDVNANGGISKNSRTAWPALWRAALVGLLALQAAACAASSPAPKTSTPPVEDQLVRRNLEAYLTAAGLNWLVVTEPARLAKQSRFIAALDPLISEARFDAFTVATGIDLRHTETALVAGYDYGDIYMATLPARGDVVLKRFARRVHAEPVVKKAHPQLTRMTSMVGATPHSLVVLEKHLMAVVAGDTTLARIVELYAQGKLDVVTALEGASLSLLPSKLREAPIRVYAPGPFEERLQQGAHGLLGGTLAVGVAIIPHGPLLEVELVAVGDWPERMDPSERLMEVWRDLASSNLGRLLGLNEPTSPARVRHSQDTLHLTVTLRTAPIANGLHAAVAAETWEFLGLPPPESAQPPP